MTKPRKPSKRPSASAVSTRWRMPRTHPEAAGWYEVLAPDNRWDGATNWRLWRNGTWWKQCGGNGSEPGSFIPYVSETGRFRWRGPARPPYMSYRSVMGLAGRPVTGDGEGCA